MAKWVVSLVLSAMAALAVASPQAYAAHDDSARPLLVIRFNQDHVYFNRALKQAVTSAENAKSGIAYHVVSTMPTGNRKGVMKVSAEQAKTNLASVTGMMQQIGVPAARIQTSAENSSSAMSQEIRIYVE